MRLVVDPAAGLLHADDMEIACSIGRGGAIEAAAKREGDGATPLGQWPIRGVLARRDRVVLPPLDLPWRWIDRADGWSDGPADPAYNRPVRHPHPFSAEHLWREDGLYDVIIVLRHNDAPAVAGAGSAIFFHCWEAGRPTEGCVSVAQEVLLRLLPGMRSGDVLEIR